MAIESFSPERIYLFGSYTEVTYSKNSDFDFYIVVGNDVSDLAGETTKAYKAIRHVKQKPVDIIVGTEKWFESQ